MEETSWGHAYCSESVLPRGWCEDTPFGEAGLLAKAEQTDETPKGGKGRHLWARRRPERVRGELPWVQRGCSARNISSPSRVRRTPPTNHAALGPSHTHRPQPTNANTRSTTTTAVSAVRYIGRRRGGEKTTEKSQVVLIKSSLRAYHHLSMALAMQSLRKIMGAFAAGSSAYGSIHPPAAPSTPHSTPSRRRRSTAHAAQHSEPIGDREAIASSSKPCSSSYSASASALPTSRST